MADVPHIVNEAAPGTRVSLSGWITTPDKTSVDDAWVDLGGFTIPLMLDAARPDVARVLALADRDGRKIGFTTVVALPADLAPGLYEARVIGRLRGGTGVYAETAQRLLIAQPCVEPRPLERAHGPVDFDIRIRDTLTAPYTLGRGAFTIRQEASLHISGFVEDADRLHVVAKSGGRNPVAWEFSCTARGRFDAKLWTGNLECGLYDLTIARIDGDRAVTVAHCGADIAGPHHLPPLHLTKLRTAPIAAITAFRDVGPAPAERMAQGLVAGRPIGISGWCLDAAARTAPNAVYIEVDGKRPIPISHRLPDPRLEVSAQTERCGFGGILDTTRLDPGKHHVSIMAGAVSGAGWYVIDQRDIVLSDHRDGVRLMERNSEDVVVDRNPIVALQ
jgi:hypothetical protein